MMSPLQRRLLAALIAAAAAAAYAQLAVAPSPSGDDPQRLAFAVGRTG